VKAAIVGGGIGGLSAAVALLRKGIDVEVFEQAAEIPGVGASLQLGPNALRLLDELGLLPALRRIGVRPDHIDLLRWDDGSLLLHAPHGDEAESYFGAPQLDFFRPDLHAVLVDAVRERLGFRLALVPPGCGPAATGGLPPEMRVVEVGDVTTALQVAVRESADLPS
jgi:salicylate hydroxylase